MLHRHRLASSPEFGDEQIELNTTMNAPFAIDTRSLPITERFQAPDPQNAGVLITGAANRIGRAIACDLAASGWPVVIHYHRSEKAALEVCDQIRCNGGVAEALAGNIAAPDEAMRLIARAQRLIGPVGVLINNASEFEWDDLATFDTASWARHMDVNLRAPALLSQSFAPMLPAGLGGVIINMLDARVLNPTPRYLSYTLSKTGLWTLTRTLAQMLAPRIRVNGIGPGPTLPPKGQSMEDFADRCALLPLQRPASLGEICQTVQFLLSVKSITGQMIALDGGDHLAPQPAHPYPLAN